MNFEVLWTQRMYEYVQCNTQRLSIFLNTLKGNSSINEDVDEYGATLNFEKKDDWNWKERSLLRCFFFNFQISMVAVISDFISYIIKVKNMIWSFYNNTSFILLNNSFSSRWVVLSPFWESIKKYLNLSLIVRTQPTVHLTSRNLWQNISVIWWKNKI